MKSLINNNDTDYTGNTNIIIQGEIQIWILKH